MAELTTRLVRRLLEAPALVETIQRLPTAQVATLIERVGVEDAGELVAMLGDEQFAELMDDVLWDGEDEFDHERFETWLEVVAEGGPSALAQRLQSLPEDTLALALFGHVFVVDAETLGIGMAGSSSAEAALAERVLDAALYLELADHKVIARRLTGWDTIIDALLALDRVDHGLLERLLDTLARATADHLDEHEGLETLLDAAESLEEDAADGRDRRRAARGFVRHADAKAFLKHAASPPSRGPSQAPERHYLTRAALRELELAQGPVVEAPLPEELATLVDASPGVTDPQLPPAGLTDLREAIESLDAAAQAHRQTELAYLANVLVAAHPELGPVTAARQVLEACAAGLRRLQAPSSRPASELLRELGMDQLFVAGWPFTGGADRPIV